MKIFLSSTYVDLTVHRQKAAEAIERLGQQGVRMEVFGARPLEPKDTCFEEIESSDALVGIYAHRYGYVPPQSEKSITEQEFDFAQQNKKPIFCFMIEDEYSWLPRHIEGEPGRAKLQHFKQRIRTMMVVDVFTSPEDLAYKVASSLGRFFLTRKVEQELERIPGREEVSTEHGRSQVARRAARLHSLLDGSHVLLVNDVPAEMSHVIGIMRGLGIEVNVVYTSDEAIHSLKEQKFDVVISDMRRGAIVDEGSRLLSRMRSINLIAPVIFTVGQFDPGRGTPPYAFGITNKVDDLLNLVFDALERIRG